MDIDVIKKRCNMLGEMNASPDLDSFDQELVCTLADHTVELVRWVERAAAVLKVNARYHVDDMTHEDNCLCCDARRLLAELTDAGEG